MPTLKHNASFTDFSDCKLWAIFASFIVYQPLDMLISGRTKVIGTLKESVSDLQVFPLVEEMPKYRKFNCENELILFQAVNISPFSSCVFFKLTAHGGELLGWMSAYKVALHSVLHSLPISGSFGTHCPQHPVGRGPRERPQWLRAGPLPRTTLTPAGLPRPRRQAVSPGGEHNSEKHNLPRPH